MATVKFSKQLRETILTNAQQLFHNRLQAAGTRLDSSVATQVYEDFMRPWQPIIEKLPAGFFKKGDRIEVVCRHVTNRHVSVADYAPQSKVVIPIEETETPQFKCYQSWSGAKIDIKDTPENAELSAKVRQWDQNINAIEAERKEFVDGVEKLIETYTTLAPALKVWPALWDLLPAETHH